MRSYYQSSQIFEMSRTDFRNYSAQFSWIDIWVPARSRTDLMSKQFKELPRSIPKKLMTKSLLEKYRSLKKFRKNRQINKTTENFLNPCQHSWQPHHCLISRWIISKISKKRRFVPFRTCVKKILKYEQTLGSKVPLCPVLSTRKIRLTQATTSWLEGLAGLSRFMQPEDT